MSDRIKFNRDNKFDLQLDQALLDEARLADVLETAILKRIELKSESYLWERTGNIAIEFRYDGKPSGLAVTEATAWAHELKRDGKTLMYLIVPIERLLEICRARYRAGYYRLRAGDNKRSSVVLLRLRDLLR